MTDQKNSQLNFIRYLSEKAGEVITISLNKPQWVESKAGFEIVTKTDKKVERLLLQLIAESEFNYPVISEEAYTGKENIKSEYLWVIDPLDGTTNFSKRIPRFSCSIALVHNGKSIVGVVYNPITNELFYAEKDKGAWLNNESLHVSPTKILKEAVICIDSGYSSLKERNKGVEVFKILAGHTRGIRLTASAALDLCDVAYGRYDAYICPAGPRFSGWDFAAGGLILNEAGGKFTNFEGKEWDLKLIDRLASNGHLHKNLIKTLTLCTDD